MVHQNDYPKIEVYSEIDQGDPNAGNYKSTDPNGNVVFGGKADYRPSILRQTYLINQAQKAVLLKTTLRWFPYFGLQKENTTLEQYFEAVANTDRYSFYKEMLPPNLNFLFSQKNNDEDYPYYGTLLVYEASYPQHFMVVWLDKNTWFVNNIFYSLDGGLLEFLEDAQEDILFEGEFDDFLRYSPIFQYKLSEGFPSINSSNIKETIPLNDIVLGIELSPSTPNTLSYKIQITGDASIIEQGIKSNEKIDPNTLTAILFEAQKLNWESYNLNKIPTYPADDQQTFSISVWKNGSLQHLSDPDLNLESPLKHFVEMVKEVPEIKSIIEMYTF